MENLVLHGGEVMIQKVVITAAGLGTRLLTVTKEQPKEMLPLFSKNNEVICIKPLLQMIFEQLYDYGFREFCFIVGRGKRIIEDHFTVDRYFITQLSNKGKQQLSAVLERFYKKVENSTIVWINQHEPKGFGHAVLMAKPFVRNEPFLVHAGDTYIYSPHSDNHIKRLIEAHGRENADATLLLKEVKNPLQYGVAQIEEEDDEIFRVKLVVEKPAKPPSNLAIMPVYAFNPPIMEALEKTKPGVGGEIQLTDAIQILIDSGHKVQAIKLKGDEIRLDVGTPGTYWEAIAVSYRYATK